MERRCVLFRWNWLLLNNTVVREYFVLITFFPGMPSFISKGYRNNLLTDDKLFRGSGVWVIDNVIKIVFMNLSSQYLPFVIQTNKVVNKKKTLSYRISSNDVNIIRLFYCCNFINLILHVYLIAYTNRS